MIGTVLVIAVCIFQAPYALLKSARDENNSLRKVLSEGFKKEDFAFKASAKPIKDSGYLLELSVKSNSSKTVSDFWINIEAPNCTLKAVDPFLRPNWRPDVNNQTVTFSSGGNEINPDEELAWTNDYGVIASCAKYRPTRKVSVKLSIKDTHAFTYNLKVAFPAKPEVAQKM